MSSAPGRYGLLCQSISLFLLLSAGFLFAVLPARAATSTAAYLDGLLNDAKRHKLADDRYWHILLHYRPAPQGVKSLIDDPRFFLSPQGARNPQAELEATVRAFFTEPEDPDNPPICRFIARYVWLKEKLQFDESKLPIAACEAFHKTLRIIKPHTASLVFPAAYMNNPASLFGHTLISIETETQSPLLARAVNYSAFTTEKNGLVFALKGLSGFYKGYYSILPYYQKVQEYNDINQRDIWEYRLNFSADEVIRMVMHIWELQNIYSYYYFFDENCSYNILFLLEAGRPSLHLTDQFHGWVIPLDTIKMLEKAGAIAATNYRPSMATRIKHLASLLDPAQQKQAAEMSHGIVSPDAVINSQLSVQKKITMIDLSIEYLQYLYATKKLSRTRYADRFLSLLNARSALHVAVPSLDKPPVSPRPEHGHHAARLGLGGGIKRSAWFQELRFRPAYHALADHDAGFDRGSQIQFFNTALRYYYEHERFELNTLDLIDIMSLSPRDVFFRPFSWKVKTGWRQALLGDGDDHLVYTVNTGGGFASSSKVMGLYYGMVEGDMKLAGAFKKNYALGIGGSAGTKKHFTDWWIMRLEARALYYALGDEHKTYALAMTHNFAINAQKSLSVEISRTKTFGRYETDAVVMMNLYF